MANKYFSYSFQLSNTKKAIIGFFILVLLIGIGYLFTIYKKANTKETYKTIAYKKVLGMNEFEDNNCDKAYRLNYDKQTCGTICINISKKNENYLKNTKELMKKNGFSLTDTKSKKINNSTWNYFNTKNAGPIFKYYVNNSNNKLYTLELIDQTNSMDKKTKGICDKNFNKLLNSLEIK